MKLVEFDMRVELLKEIIHSLLGEKSKGVVELLVEKDNVNEFIIAKKLHLTINQTRNLLYKLLDEGLVTVTRKKNLKKGGWYDHFWTLNLEKTLTKYKESLTHKINQSTQNIHTRNKTRYYICETCNIELHEEQALLQEYTCLECGQLLVLKDNKKDIAVLEKEIASYQKTMIEVDAELAIIFEKNNKIRARKMKAEEKKKEKEKALKKKEREKLKELAKGEPNKKIKKPSKK